MKKQAALIAFALLLAGGVSYAAVQQEQRSGEARHERGGRLERLLDGRHSRGGFRMERRHRGREFLRSLDISDAQKEQARAVAQSLKPLADEVRPQAQPLLARARELARSGDPEGARELLRNELRPILKDAFERARPFVQPLVGTLTTEQRAKLEALAEAHGRKFDEERFTRRLAWHLALRGERGERR